MLSWILALVLGPALAFGQYRLGAALHQRRMLALRALTFTTVFVLLFDAPIGLSRFVRPYAALDASASWMASGDTAAWGRARRAADSVGTDTLLLVGDTVRAGTPPAVPGDRASRAAPLVERALGAGRAVTFVTDGRIDDPQRLEELPAGSRVIVVEPAARRDAAVASLEVPGSAVAGDTIDVSAVISAGSAGSLGGRIEVFLDAASIATVKLDSLGAFAEREVSARVAVGATPGARLLRAVVTVAGDAVPRNDTLIAVLDIAAGASAVFVSTAPDFDSRYALDVLRGTLAVPTRGYFRVAPTQWRMDGTLAAVPEEEVRKHALEAPLVVLHGDTAVFGAPRAVTRGALALLAPPTARSDDFYPTGAPPSPLTASLAALPWDSLPPVEVAEGPRDAEWVAVTAKRGRRLDERAIVSGTSRPRRIVVVPAAGLWRWRFRGGRTADVYLSLWGSIFDWMTGETVDSRGIRPVSAWLREGEPVRWRRGGLKDSAATVVLSAGGAPRADTLTLRFGSGANVAESPPLAPGVYTTRVGDATGLLAINQSAEWVPRRSTVRVGPIGSAPAVGRAPRARGAWWLFAVALAAMCTEWVLRRRIGMR